jgi:hypothetical protein
MNHDADDAPVPPLVAASWQRAETLAYSTVTERPDLYQQVVRLVRLTADHLRLLGPGTTALLSADQRGADLVAAVAEDSGIPAWDLDLDVVAGAALALRYREVRGEQAARERLRRLDAGRSSGRPVVVVEESGNSDGDPFLPYTRLDVEVATGHGVLVTTLPDDDFRDVVHGVREVQLDLQSGAVRPDPERPDVATYPDAAARDAAAARALQGGGRDS